MARMYYGPEALQHQSPDSRMTLGLTDDLGVFYLLLCMFNGFAFAPPLCQPIKGNLTGGGTIGWERFCVR